MSRIEPELMIQNAALVEEMYRRNSETEEQRKKRLERYEVAFERFDEALLRLEKTEYATLRRKRLGAIQQAEATSAEADTAKLESLNADLDHADV
jgi:hypothetical protein